MRRRLIGGHYANRYGDISPRTLVCRLTIGTSCRRRQPSRRWAKLSTNKVTFSYKMMFLHRFFAVKIRRILTRQNQKVKSGMGFLLDNRSSRSKRLEEVQAHSLSIERRRVSGTKFSVSWANHALSTMWALKTWWVSHFKRKLTSTSLNIAREGATF